jgi:hypothetical protein
VLQSEQKQKYDAWASSSGATLTDDEQEIFGLVTTMRNSIEKKGHANIEARSEKVSIPESHHPVHGTHYFGPPESGRPTTIIDGYYVQGTSREVLALCEQYLAILTRQVQDFEKHATQ